MKLLRPLLRGLPVVIGVMAICVSIAKWYLRHTTPMYESTAKIKLADTHEGVPNSNLFKDFDVFANTNKLGAEVELLKSEVLMSKVVERMKLGITVYRVGEMLKKELYDESPFIVSANITNEKWFNKPIPFVVSKKSEVSLVTPDGKMIRDSINHLIITSGGTFSLVLNTELVKSKPNLNIDDKYELVVHSHQAQVEDLLKNMDVMSVDKDIPVLRISYKSPVAKKAAEVVNTVAVTYITDYIEEKYKSADTTSAFLNKQLAEFSKRLSASESAIEDFRNDRNIISIRQETETDLREISDLKKQLASVQMNITAIHSLNDYLRAGEENFTQLAPNYFAYTDLLSVEMQKKINALLQERRDLLMKYTPEDEKVKVITDKIEDIKTYVLESVKNTENHLQKEYADLQNTIKTVEDKFIGLPTREKTMAILERNFGLNEQIYRFLHEKRTEAEIAKAATISFHRVIAEGEIPKMPVSPNATIIKVFAGFLGFLAGVFGIYFVHFIKSRVNDEENISKTSGTPIHQSVPHFKQVRLAIPFFTRWAHELDIKNYLNNGTVICFSSHKEKEGKTYNSSQLKNAVESLEKKVLYINAETDIKDNLLIPDRWKEQLSLWKKNYDVIIIKNFPLSKEPASLLLMATAQLNLMILDSRRTRKNRIVQSDLMQEDLKLPGMEFVLNRAGYTPSLFTQAKEMIKAIPEIKEKFIEQYTQSKSWFKKKS